MHACNAGRRILSPAESSFAGSSGNIFKHYSNENEEQSYPEFLSGNYGKEQAPATTRLRSRRQPGALARNGVRRHRYTDGVVQTKVPSVLRGLCRVGKTPGISDSVFCARASARVNRMHRELGVLDPRDAEKHLRRFNRDYDGGEIFSLTNSNERRVFRSERLIDLLHCLWKHWCIAQRYQELESWRGNSLELVERQYCFTLSGLL